MPRLKNTTGIILAGGKSSRLNQKALLKIRKKSVIESIVSTFHLLFDETFINTNDEKQFQHFGVPLIQDIVTGKGPLGGIYSSLTFSSNKRNFICACDMPFVNAELIEYMSQFSNKYDIVVPFVNNYFETLHAFYSKRCLEKIKEHLESDILKVSEFYAFFKVRKITIDEVNSYNRAYLSWFNMNTSSDFEKANKIACSCCEDN